MLTNHSHLVCRQRPRCIKSAARRRSCRGHLPQSETLERGRRYVRCSHAVCPRAVVQCAPAEPERVALAQRRLAAVASAAGAALRRRMHRASQAPSPPLQHKPVPVRDPPHRFAQSALADLRPAVPEPLPVPGVPFQRGNRAVLLASPCGSRRAGGGADTVVTSTSGCCSRRCEGRRPAARIPRFPAGALPPVAQHRWRRRARTGVGWRGTCRSGGEKWGKCSLTEKNFWENFDRRQKYY